MKARIARTVGVVAVLLALDYLLLLGIGLLLTKVFKGDGWLTSEDDINTDLAHHRTAPLNDVTLRRCPAWATPAPSSAR